MAWCSEGSGSSPREEAGVGYGRPEFDFKAILAKRAEGERMIEEALILSAATLARSNPEVWKQFMAALGGRVNEAGNALIASDLASLQLNQGRAQAYNTLFRTLNECVQKQEQIERRQSNA